MRHLVCSLALAAFAVSARAELSVVAHFPIGGDDSGYDYVRVDPVGRRIYVAHGKRFEVLDADTGKKVGEIAPVTRAHGVAIAPEAGHGFASSGVDDMITMFDLKTLATIKTFKSSGSNPDAIEYDPETKRVYAANHGETGDVAVIDPASGDIVATVKLNGAKLEGIAFDGRGHGFVNDEDKSSVHVFDTHALKYLSTWSSAPGEGGTGIACDAAHHRVFSACSNNKVIVFDSDSGKIVTTVASGEDPDGITFDAKNGLIVSSNPDGTMTVIHEDSPDKFTALPAVSTMTGARTIGFDEKTGRFFSCAPKFGPPPPPVKGGPKPRPKILAGTFEVIAVGSK